MREVYRLQQLHLWHPHAFLLYEQQQKWNYNFITARYFKHFLFTSFWYSIRKGSILFLMVTVVFNKKKCLRTCFTYAYAHAQINGHGSFVTVSFALSLIQRSFHTLFRPFTCVAVSFMIYNEVKKKKKIIHFIPT